MSDEIQSSDGTEVVEVSTSDRFWTWDKIKYTAFALIVIVGGTMAYLEHRETKEYHANPAVGDIVYYVHDEKSDTPIRVFMINKVLERLVYYTHSDYEFNTAAFAQKTTEKKGKKAFEGMSQEFMSLDKYKNLDIKHITRPEN